MQNETLNIENEEESRRCGICRGDGLQAAEDGNDGSRAAVTRKICECEQNGAFDRHVNPVDGTLTKPIDEKSNYFATRTIRIKRFFERSFLVKPYTFWYTRRVMRAKIVGKEHLKGLSGMVAVCNHVHIFDCLLALRGLKGRRVHITAAPFNNRNDFLGEMMRAGGMIPFGDSLSRMRAFDAALEGFLKRGDAVLFYPEQAMWPYYEKPRPFKNGAFFYAAKHGIPVVPMFITFRPSGKKDAEGFDKPYFTLNILPPVFPSAKKSPAENTDALRETVYGAYRDCYAAVYGKPLCFARKEEKV